MRPQYLPVVQGYNCTPLYCKTDGDKLMHCSPLFLLVSAPTVAASFKPFFTARCPSLGFLYGRRHHRPSIHHVISSNVGKKIQPLPPQTCSYFVDCTNSNSGRRTRTVRSFSSRIGEGVTVMSAKESDCGEDCHDADELGDGGGGDCDDGELAFHPGIPKEYSIIQYRTMPETGFAEEELNATFKRNDIERLKLTPDDVTTTAALLMLYPEQYQR